MSFAPNVEVEIKQEVENLRKKFPATKQLYREVCILLFFRYGIQPTANKLYQLVRKGTMSTPAEAVNKFWQELRDKSRIQIDHPGLPKDILQSAGELVSTLWISAQDAAAKNYEVLNSELLKNMEVNLKKTEEAQTQLINQVNATQKLESDLANANARLLEAEKKSLVDTSTLSALKESLKTFELQRAALEAALALAQATFSSDLEKLNTALHLSDERFRSLEAKTLVDLDRERQLIKKQEIIIKNNAKELLSLQEKALRENSNYQSKIFKYIQERSLVKGQLKESQRAQLLLSKKLRRLEISGIQLEPKLGR